jgi:diketogulonate reductase-like aldo/keto reductase
VLTALPKGLDTRRIPAQVLLRWSRKKGFVATPKSAKRQRIIENAAVFDFSLGAEQMVMLDSFNEEHHVIPVRSRERSVIAS